jgi:hypothetical protein
MLRPPVDELISGPSHYGVHVERARTTGPGQRACSSRQRRASAWREPQEKWFRAGRDPERVAAIGPGTAMMVP